MPNDRTNTEASLEEQLVAYLDGELDADENHRIEELLLSDPEVRRAMQRLDRTWDLLDELDRPGLDDRFTQSTLEMVTMAATKDVKEAKADAPRRQRRRWVLSGVAMLVAGLVGFAVVAWWGGAENRRLVRDLPILLDLDSYRQVEDLDFLRMLHKQGLFVEADPPEGAQSSPFAGIAVDRARDPAAARRIIEEMSLADKDQLRRRQEQFASLSAESRQKIHRFHDRLREAPDVDQLREVMRRYHQWLVTIPPYERAELIDLDPEDRLRSIERHLGIERQKRVLAQDIEGLIAWSTAYAKQNEERLLKAMPEKVRGYLRGFPEPYRHRLLGLSLVRPRQEATAASRVPVDTGDLDGLCSRLSPQTQATLRGLSDVERWKVIQRKVGFAFQQRRFGAGRDLFPQASEEELDEFFDKELTAKQKDRLLGLPGEEMRAELRKQYFAKKLGWPFAAYGMRRGPWGRGPGPSSPDRDRGNPPRNGHRPENRPDGQERPHYKRGETPHSPLSPR